MSETPKDIIFEEAARKELLNGLKKLSTVTACTLGPKGRHVGLEKSWGAPTITSDGNTIVKDIELENPFENMGVLLGKEVAQKIKDKCGDGSTRGILLLNAMVEEGIKLIAAGASPIGVKRGIEKCLDKMLEEISSQATPVKDDKEIEQLAAASASGDQEVGHFIAEAFKKVGKTGVVNIEESKTVETSIKMVEGMQFDRGYISGYFCTNLEKMLVEMHNPYILISEKKIQNIHELLPILQQMATTGKELLIIADDIEGDALSTLVVNKLRGTLKVAAVKAPGYGENRKALLQDIAILTGGTVISEDTGVSLKEIPLTSLGSCGKLIVTKEETTIIEGKGAESDIKARVKQIEAEIPNATSNYDKEKLEKRKASLAGGIAQIQVGASTESELKAKKQRYEDSLSSIRAALEEGVVVGGCVAFLKAIPAIDKLKLEGDEKLGGEILKKACQAPLRQLVHNAGFDGSVIVNEVLTKGGNFGFNVETDQVEDLAKAGILDAAKVIKNSLSHACGMAGLILISEALITNSPEDESVAV